MAQRLSATAQRREERLDARQVSGEMTLRHEPRDTATQRAANLRMPNEPPSGAKSAATG